jgi:hypothetical protein
MNLLLLSQEVDEERATVKRLLSNNKNEAHEMFLAGRIDIFFFNVFIE